MVVDFQHAYFKAFPAHTLWHEWTDVRLRRTGTLISLTGRKRQFWGRRNDESVLREAIAYDPQCSLADIVNRAMLRVWSEGDATLMLQDHDAITIQYPESAEDTIIPRILKQLEVPIQLKNGRTLLIPYDCKVGWNRGDYSKDNVDGLKDYTGHDERRRSPKVHLLDRKLR